MRRLWLLRHAKSSWEGQVPDQERPLAPRGVRAAAAMGRYLDDAGVRPDVVICSTARRASETLAGVLPGLGTGVEVRFDEDAYTFSADDLLALVRALPNGATSALLVGHNPAITQLVSRLASEGRRLDEASENVPTAGLAGLDLDVASWSDVGKDSGVLATYVLPRELETQP
jgi:phosphohistidine phosphatase